MNVSIFGLGYVGCVGAGCLSALGHRVIGVDTAPNKVNLINAGRPTIIEKGIDQLIETGVREKRISATNNVTHAITASEVSIITVGTPSGQNGHLKLNYIFAVAEQIGLALKKKDSFHVIAIRSTVLPGTNETVGKIIEKASEKKRNVDFSVISNPEFLREGTAVYDYMHPPLTLIGGDNEYGIETIKELYKTIPGEVVVTDIRVAEIMKYVNNTYHALKVVFGNEVGNICKALEIDSHEVMSIFCKDKQLNISPYYFKPGFAYGGSCLPKDTAALRALAHDKYINVPVINSINSSNDYQKAKAIELITSYGKLNVGILGLSFKAGTDDLRNSPIVDVIEELIGKGYHVRIYDRNVKLSEITGTNKDFISARIPHLQSLITDDLSTVAQSSDILVLTNKEEEFQTIPDKFCGKIIIDLVRMWTQLDYDGHYEGISWANINRNPAQARPVERDNPTTDF